MISKFLDPRNDLAFKRVFGTERNKDILIHFLNDVVVFQDNGKIQDVTFLKTVQDPALLVRKTSIVDVLCVDNNGHQYIVEMQVAKEKGFEKRAQYYAAKAYGSQLETSQEYHQLKPVLFIAITDFVMFPNHNRYKSDHVVLDTQDQNHYLQDLKFTFLELPKFNKSIQELDTMTDKWCYFFKNASHTSEEDAEQIGSQFPVLERAYTELNRYKWSEEELRGYEEFLKNDRDYVARLAQKYDEGLEKGEVLAKKEIAQKMLKAGISVDQISSMTGLSPSEIATLETF